MDYSKTLNLPATDFPMRANLPQREPEIAGFWDEIDVYQLVQAKNAGRPKFVLHDGPPYANGHIHLGHVLNKVLKDMVVKFKAMDGYDAPYVPGWDTHGLPIEQQAIKQLRLRRDELGPVEFRRICRDYALRFVDIQREEFRRLGVRGDWRNPYLTLQPHFETRQIEVFGEMAKRGYIYKGLKSVYWCSTCETALAEAEVEYAEKESPSIYVAFPVVEDRGLLPAPGTAVVIWTTTPWTIPSNVGICLHPEFDYVILRSGDRRYLVARELADSFRKVLADPGAEVEREYRGEELEGVICRHPFLDRDSVVVLDDYVTLEQGTGCVHIAPGHGTEDFALGQKYNLPVISPINSKGCFTAEAGSLEGLFYLDANAAVIQELETRGALVGHSGVRHQYPHCWRCKHPVFFRATEQWFASIDSFRSRLLDAIDRVKWIPEWGRERIHGMVSERGDWCISRQRLWGVPIPIFYCADCQRAVITEETIEHLKGLFRAEGSDVWYAREVEELHPPGLRCPHCGGNGKFTKELDTMDVWFDSGSSHWGVLTQPDFWPELRWPADLYLEGSDQHRGWFNSSLTTSVAVTGEPPYRAVLTHGFVVDEHGRKMSKSLGNVVDPAVVLKDLGADILRLWVCSADYRGDLAVSPVILKQLSEAYRKIRNTFRFLLGNLNDFDPERDTVADTELEELDRYALLKLHRVTDRVLRAYREYEYHQVYHSLYNYCVTDLSAFYLNVVKDRLYCEPAGALTRRAVQTVMYAILDDLVRLLVPVLAFTTEEIWRYFPGNGKKPPSVQLLEMPEPNPEYFDDQLEQRWERLLAVRQDVLRVLEGTRKEKLIRDSLEAEVILYAENEALLEFLRENARQLRLIFVTSSIRVVPAGQGVPEDALDGALPGLKVSATRAPGRKCVRCWTYAETGVDPEHPEVCPRCTEVLKQNPE
ncbi:MAG: isoleucine--tRNA ligase [Candidatus Desulforudis sp.]|nr:isoleucine--tRNA ligase [Desulforudis sp.]